MKTLNQSGNDARVLLGKVVVITGASSGAGRAAAMEFAKYKTILILAARRLDVLNELAVACSGLGSKAIAIQTDVTDPIAMKQLAASAVEFAGRIDIWVNNAGVLAAGGFDDTPIEVHDQVIKTNLMGYMHGAHAVLPYFKRQQSGILINNISIGGLYPTPYAVGYSASKFGLRGFSEALKGELHAWSNIHVCDLYPAFLDTPGIKHAANYTGKLLKPAPPVYDPQKLARAMVALAIQPRKSMKVGGAAYALHLGYLLMPAVMRFITAKVMETYFKQAESSPLTSGNVFAPLEFGTGIHGDKDKGAAGSKKGIAIGLMLGGLAASLLYMRQLKGKTR